MFVLDNGEQLDITADQAKSLINAGFIYNPEPENSSYFTTYAGITIDDVVRYLKGN